MPATSGMISQQNTRPHHWAKRSMARTNATRARGGAAGSAVDTGLLPWWRSEQITGRRAASSDVAGEWRAMKLAHWSLHFYRLPYVREVRWVYASESSGDYALLTIVGDNGTAGVAEGVIKPTR